MFIKFKKESKEYQMILDFWNMCQNFWVPEDRDEYWMDLIKATDGFAAKYKELSISEDLAVALIMYLQKKGET